MYQRGIEILKGFYHEGTKTSNFSKSPCISRPEGSSYSMC